MYHLKKTHKYHAIKTEIDGIVFDSKKEARRYSELKLLVKTGELVSFDRQVVFPILFEGQLLCKYVADFVTYSNHGLRTVEDVKGMRTRIYQLKKKMMRIINRIEIVEI
jgi:hypothetical protein